MEVTKYIATCENTEYSTLNILYATIHGSNIHSLLWLSLYRRSNGAEALKTTAHKLKKLDSKPNGPFLPDDNFESFIIKLV